MLIRWDWRISKLSCRDSVQDSELFVPRSMANEMSDVHISWDSTVNAAKAWLSSALDMQYRDALRLESQHIQGTIA